MMLPRSCPVAAPVVPRLQVQGIAACPAAPVKIRSFGLISLKLHNHPLDNAHGLEQAA